MASQTATAGVDDKVAKPSPVLHLLGHRTDMTPPLSWDRDTVGGESYLSAQSDLSKSTAPLMMATAKSTPPAMTSSLHHWESAEVLHASQIGSDFSEPREPQNPFSDSASSVKSIPRGQNPFFSGRDHTVRRTLLPNPHENPFADSNAARDSATAIQSLIAALEVPMDRDSNHRIVSVQSSVYSRMTGDDGDSAIDFTAFPYPPTSQTNTR
ncbi:hypothetical protein JVU11DRAFT_4005 [Chiua virens]|nr:hypothetical protein JVU11DRAFT_4005 [Chiua virens]